MGRLGERQIADIANSDLPKLTKTQAFALESAIEHGGVFARHASHGRHGGAYRRMVECMIADGLLRRDRTGAIVPTDLGRETFQRRIRDSHLT